MSENQQYTLKDIQEALSESLTETELPAGQLEEFDFEDGSYHIKIDGDDYDMPAVTDEELDSDIDELSEFLNSLQEGDATPDNVLGSGYVKEKIELSADVDVEPGEEFELIENPDDNAQSRYGLKFSEKKLIIAVDEEGLKGTVRSGLISLDLNANGKAIIGDLFED